eukprot:scaffold10537_cov122-Isochrysis_galbana.AAC.10
MTQLLAHGLVSQSTAGGDAYQAVQLAEASSKLRHAWASLRIDCSRSGEDFANGRASRPQQRSSHHLALDMLTKTPAPSSRR